MKIQIETTGPQTTITVADETQQISITLVPGQQPTIVHGQPAAGRRADK